MFGLTGEALANRIRAAARAAGLGEDFSGHSGRIGMARRMVAAGAPTAAVQHQGRWKHGDMVARYTRGEAAGPPSTWKKGTGRQPFGDRPSWHWRRGSLPTTKICGRFGNTGIRAKQPSR